LTVERVERELKELEADYRRQAKTKRALLRALQAERGETEKQAEEDDGNE
jgi:hypothetical protein